MKNKKGDFTMSQIAIIIITVIALVIIILFVTGQWQKLVHMLTGVTDQTNQSVSNLNVSSSIK
jgi:uncharacterized membrane protein affecting hemolysin expression